MATNNKIRTLSLAVIIAASFGSAPATAQTIGQDTRTGLALTLYQNGTAFIRDTRLAPLKSGESDLVFEDVGRTLVPDSAFLEAGDGKGDISIQEQTFRPQSLSPQALLKHHLGKEITIIPEDKEIKPLRGKLLSLDGGPLFLINGKVHSQIKGRYVFDTLPTNLTTTSSLVVRIENNKTETRNIALNYLAGGLDWQANYIVRVNKDDTALSLQARAAVTNNSGMDIKEADLSLLAGDVARVKTPRAPRGRELGIMSATAEMASDEGVRRESFSGFHLYKVDAPLTLADGKQKQVSLAQAPAVKTSKEYIAQGQNHYYRSSAKGNDITGHARMRLTFKNEKENGLGLPLPAGLARVYSEDKSGGLNLAGESHIPVSAVGDRIYLNLGTAFDVRTNRKQTDYRRIDKRTSESAYAIEIRNAGDRKVTVKVIEPIPGDWKILNESHKHKKADARRAEWAIKVPAKGKTTLTYQVKTWY